MPALPVYEVQFVPTERRLNDRRNTPMNSALPKDVKMDRRMIFGRRSEERKMAGSRAPFAGLFLLMRPQNACMAE